MLASTFISPYETPLFGIIVASGMAWLGAFIYCLRSQENRTRSTILAFAINIEIGILSALAFVWGMGTSIDARFSNERIPDDSLIQQYEQLSSFDPTTFLGDLRFYYRISEVGMWIYLITFIPTIFAIMRFIPKEKKKPNKAEMATPRKPSD